MIEGEALHMVVKCYGESLCAKLALVITSAMCQARCLWNVKLSKIRALCYQNP